MSYRIVITGAAEDDVAQIYRWIYRRSPQGAYRWIEAWEAVSKGLSTEPERHPIACDLRVLGEDIHEAYFKTLKGKRYRVLFIIIHEDIRILHVRGPGQALIQP